MLKQLLLFAKSIKSNFLDCCGVAENSYFIHIREEGYKNKTYKEIAQELFSLTDGSIMSAKKDGLVNMGGSLSLRKKELYPHIPVAEYPGQALVCELYLTGGIRAVEIGSVMFGKYDEPAKLIPASMELVRLAIPRRVYTQSHIEYVVEVFEKILKNKN